MLNKEDMKKVKELAEVFHSKKIINLDASTDELQKIVKEFEAHQPNSSAKIRAIAWRCYVLIINTDRSAESLKGVKSVRDLINYDIEHGVS